MAQDSLKQQRRKVAIAYVLMFFALFTLISGVIAYYLARNVSQTPQTEVWLNAQALWVMRSTLLYLILAAFASLWFIPLNFYYWDSYLWVTACTVVGVVFALIAFLYLLNAWFKGVVRFMKNKPVF